MLRFEWNALRVGDRVIVHDPSSAEMPLIAGVVAMIDAHLRKGDPNGVAIRVGGDDGPTRVVRPSLVAVHLDPLDVDASCWRCEELAVVAAADMGDEFAGPAAPRLCGRCRRTFPGDATLAMGLDTGWWACPDCHAHLVGPHAMASGSHSTS